MTMDSYPCPPGQGRLEFVLFITFRELQSAISAGKELVRLSLIAWLDCLDNPNLFGRARPLLRVLVARRDSICPGCPPICFNSSPYIQSQSCTLLIVINPTKHAGRVPLHGTINPPHKRGFDLKASISASLSADPSVVRDLRTKPTVWCIYTDTSGDLHPVVSLG